MCEFVNKKMNGVPYGHSWGEAAEEHAIGEQQLKWMQSGNNG